MQNENATAKRPIVAMVFDRKGEIKKGATTAPIILRIYFRKTTFHERTGYYCTPKEWDEAKKEVTQKSENRNANRYFYDFRDKVENIYLDHLKKGKDLTVLKLKQLLKVKNSSSFLEFAESELKKKECTIASLKGLATTLNTFKQYNKDVCFDDVDVRFLELYDKHLTTKKLSKNTRNKHFRHLRMFWNAAIKYDYTNTYPFKNFKLQDEYTERDHLTADEFQTLFKTNTESLNTRCNGRNTVQAVLDMYIFACITGLRISDVLAMEPKQIKQKNGIITIDVKQQKTGDKITAHFEKLSTAICPQYKDTLLQYVADAKELKRRTVFPQTSPQNANKLMKNIAELAGIDKNLTFHTSRHTCAMLLLNEGKMPLDIVSKVLGHKNIKTTQVYAKMRDETVSDALDGMLSIWK
jgi:integrase